MFWTESRIESKGLKTGFQVHLHGFFAFRSLNERSGFSRSGHVFCSSQHVSLVSLFPNYSPSERYSMPMIIGHRDIRRDWLQTPIGPQVHSHVQPSLIDKHQQEVSFPVGLAPSAFKPKNSWNSRERCNELPGVKWRSNPFPHPFFKTLNLETDVVILT